MDICINAMVEKYDGAISLLCTIHGIDRSSAITVISEIGVDMARFGSSKRLCCWAGLTPGNNESAGKKKSVRISRAGVYLKPALVQAVHAAVNDKTNPYYVLKYERIVKHRGKKRAIIAIVRMILTAIFSILSIGQIGTLLTCSILMCLSTSWSNNVLKLSNRPFVSFNHKGLRLVSFLSTPNFLPQKIFAFRGRGLRPPEVRFLSENLSH